MVAVCGPAVRELFPGTAVGIVWCEAHERRFLAARWVGAGSINKPSSPGRTPVPSVQLNGMSAWEQGKMGTRCLNPTPRASCRAVLVQGAQMKARGDAEGRASRFWPCLAWVCVPWSLPGLAQRCSPSVRTAVLVLQPPVASFPASRHFIFLKRLCITVH